MSPTSRCSSTAWRRPPALSRLPTKTGITARRSAPGAAGIARLVDGAVELLAGRIERLGLGGGPLRLLLRSLELEPSSLAFGALACVGLAQHRGELLDRTGRLDARLLRTSPSGHVRECAASVPLASTRPSRVASSRVPRTRSGRRWWYREVPLGRVASTESSVGAPADETGLVVSCAIAWSARAPARTFGRHHVRPLLDAE